MLRMRAIPHRPHRKLILRLRAPAKRLRRRSREQLRTIRRLPSGYFACFSRRAARRAPQEEDEREGHEENECEECIIVIRGEGEGETGETVGDATDDNEAPQPDMEGGELGGGLSLLVNAVVHHTEDELGKQGGDDEEAEDLVG